MPGDRAWVAVACGFETRDTGRGWSTRRGAAHCCAMRHSLYEAGHEDFRAMVRGWAEKTVVPFHDRWEKDGIVPRQVWLSGGAQGLLGMDVPEEFGGGGVTRLPLQRRPRRGDDPDRRQRGGLHACTTTSSRPYLLDLATDEQKKRWLPGVRQRRADHRDRDDRAGRGPRPAGHPDDGPQGRRRLGAERLEDVHHQRHQRRPGHRRRQDRPRGARPKGISLLVVERGHAGLRARAATSTRSA